MLPDLDNQQGDVLLVNDLQTTSCCAIGQGFDFAANEQSGAVYVCAKMNQTHVVL